jgi:hypothetical protein
MSYWYNKSINSTTKEMKGYHPSQVFTKIRTAQRDGGRKPPVLHKEAPPASAGLFFCGRVTNVKNVYTKKVLFMTRFDNVTRGHYAKSMFLAKGVNEMRESTLELVNNHQIIEGGFCRLCLNEDPALWAEVSCAYADTARRWERP